VVTGSFAGMIDFGGGNVPSANDAMTRDVFVTKLAAANGAHVWSNGFAKASDQIGNRVAVDGRNNVIVTGAFKSKIDFGGGDIASPGSAFNVFVAKFRADGTHIWSKSFGDNTDQNGWDVAVDPLGNVIIAGGFQGTANFGGAMNTLTSLDGFDIFAVKLKP